MVQVRLSATLRLLGTVTFAQQGKGSAPSLPVKRVSQTARKGANRNASTSPQAAARCKSLLVAIETGAKEGFGGRSGIFPPALGRHGDVQPWRALDGGRVGRDRSSGGRSSSGERRSTAGGSRSWPGRAARYGGSLAHRPGAPDARCQGRRC